MSDRRGLLGAFGAAVLLGACGDDDRPAQRAEEARGGDSSLADIALLNDALAAERRTVGVLPGANEHVRTLQALILREGGEPLALGDASSGRGDPERAAEELVAFYVDLLAKLAEPTLRVEAGALLSEAARALAQARARRGADPAPEAFVAGRGPA